MTRDEAQAVIDALVKRAEKADEHARQAPYKEATARWYGVKGGFAEAAGMLAEALEKSEAADRGTMINAAASAGAAMVDAQGRLDRAPKKDLSACARAEESLIAATDRKREIDAALAKVSP